MSYSSMFCIDKKYRGKRVQEYPNSWIFSPFIWHILEVTYMKKDENGRRLKVLSLFGESAWGDINTLMNNSEHTDERICWELSNQNIFLTKDKEVIANAILDFVKNHKDCIDDEMETQELIFKPHIIDRFNQVATDIKQLDENKYPYFVFKNTSVDDTVECWFYYDKKLRRHKRLNDWDNLDNEVVEIENQKIKKFINITKYIAQQIIEI